MPIVSLKKDLFTILGLVMLGVVVLCIGVLTSRTVTEIQLMRDGEAVALRWAKFLEQRPDDTWRTFEQRRLEDQTSGIFQSASLLGRVLTYELYDSKGSMFYSNGAANWHPAEHPAELLTSPVTQDHIGRGWPTTRLHAGKDPDGPSHYASVVIPFHLGNEYLGSIVAFVDQTQQARVLTQSLNIISAATVLLLLIAFGVPSTVIALKIRQHLKAEAHIRYLSEHDGLTGLPNRETFKRHLSDLLDKRRRESGRVAVVAFDVDRFHEVNDASGHTAGDAVLHSVADCLRSLLPEGDIAARVGSDDFLFTLSGIESPGDVGDFVRKLKKAFQKSPAGQDDSNSCTLSFGIVIAPADGDDVGLLLRHVNLALTRAQDNGVNVVQFFERGMDVAFLRRRERENDLRRAVEQEQFHMVYQPQVSLKNGTIDGHEALIRWDHPVHGKISPAYFIPLAEETELIVPMGEWALQRACADAKSLPAEIKLAVNLSPVQFQRGDIVATVRKALKKTGLDPSLLEIEITENVLMNDTDSVLKKLNGLRDLGVAIAMDDFGTGYSSLNYLSRFRFDKIKIDKHFVQNMHRDEAIKAIVKCVIAMGASLGVEVVAEGVETEDQTALLKKLGCYNVQGFLYGHPLTAEESAKRLQESLKPVPQAKLRTSAA